MSGNSTLKGQVAVVTGSSSGIGRAIALELANCGADVVVHGRKNVDGAEQTAEEIRQRDCRSHVVMGDIGTAESRISIVEECWQRFGPIQVWVNNAGADVLTGGAAEWSFEEKLNHLWNTDVAGTIALCRDVGARMRKQDSSMNGRYSIVNIGWDQASFGMSGDSGEMFATTKGAIMAFTRSLARSLAPQVRVNCVAPGWIKTKWGEDAPEYWNKRAINESLMERWGAPEDVAKVVRFVVSPDAGFLTGQIVDVNGGHRGEVRSP